VTKRKELSMPETQTQNIEYHRYHRNINVMAKFVTVLALVVVSLGGTTKSKEAGLTIAEPVTFAWVPEWIVTENINAEYTHRIVAFLLACSTLVLTGLVLAKEKRSAVRKLAVWALVAVIAQAVVGALTVKFMARAHTSIPHAVLGQTFFCIALSLACITSRRWTSDVAPKPAGESPSLAKLGTFSFNCFSALRCGMTPRPRRCATATRTSLSGT
jgi:heme A synthase